MITIIQERKDPKTIPGRILLEWVTSIINLSLFSIKRKTVWIPRKWKNSLAGSWTMMFSSEHKQSSENISSVWVRSLQDYVLNETETKATLVPSNHGTPPPLTWVTLTRENSKLLPPGKNLRHPITKLSPLLDNILSRTPSHFHKPSWGSPRMSPNPIVPPSSFILGCVESSINLTFSCRGVPGGSWSEGFSKGRYH